MRFAIPTTIFALALVAMVGVLPRPALAADTSRASHGAEPLRLAQNDGQNLYALWQQIQSLQHEVRQLRGKNQMLEHQIQRNTENRKRMYQQLDDRITALEGGGAATADQEAVKKAYLAAFGKLRDKKYADASSSFAAFVKQYPDNSYSDNAWYWLGQARYVQGNLDGALSALQTVTEKFPESDKAPSALYRIGVIEQTQGKADKARSTLSKIIRNYADSDSADRAREKLKAMGG